MSDQCIARAVWGPIEDQRPFTIDDLRVITGLEPAPIVAYLHLLHREGYVHLCGFREIDSGECILKLWLTVRHGPEPPHCTSNGEFIDPNLLPVTPLNRQQSKVGLTARIKVVAEKMQDEMGTPWLTKNDMEYALGFPVEDPEFSRTWARLKAIGVLTRTGCNHVPGGCWTYERPPADNIIERIRSYLRSHPDQDLTASDLKRDLLAIDGPAERARALGPKIRAAIDLLRAEGHLVQTRRQSRKHDQTVYRVTLRESNE